MNNTIAMLKRLDNKTIQGPGFIIRVPDIHHVEYVEGEKIASIGIEGGLGPDNRVNWDVYSETLRGWEKPYQNIEMDRAKYEEILNRLGKSLDLLDMRHVIV